MSTLNLTYPRDRDIHTLADFMELACLIDIDREMSIATLADIIRDNKGNASFANITEDEGNDILNQISWRVSAYGDCYPFTRLSDSKRITTANQLSLAQRSYILLLLCANLPMINPKQRQSFTDVFELFCAECLKSIWPIAGQVTPFGKNNTSFTGLKHERINQLSLKIGGGAHAKAEHFRKTDSGDAGIDLAAWVTLDEHEHQNIPSALAQCACSRTEWVPKQSEISYDRLCKILTPSARWVEFLFCPISFRDNLGKWAVPAEVSAILLVDRLRIVKILEPLESVSLIALPPSFEDTIAPNTELV